MDLDVLFENALAEAQLEAGVNPAVVATRHPTAMVCPFIVAAPVKQPRPPRWSQNELHFS